VPPETFPHNSSDPISINCKPHDLLGDDNTQPGMQEGIRSIEDLQVFAINLARLVKDKLEIVLANQSCSA